MKQQCSIVSLFHEPNNEHSALYPVRRFKCHSDFFTFYNNTLVFQKKKKIAKKKCIIERC